MEKKIKPLALGEAVVPVWICRHWYRAESWGSSWGRPVTLKKHLPQYKSVCLPAGLFAQNKRLWRCLKPLVNFYPKENKSSSTARRSSNHSEKQETHTTVIIGWWTWMRSMAFSWTASFLWNFPRTLVSAFRLLWNGFLFQKTFFRLLFTTENTSSLLCALYAKWVPIKVPCSDFSIY